MCLSSHCLAGIGSVSLHCNDLSDVVRVRHAWHAAACLAGDSACSLPAQTIPENVLKVVREWTLSIAKELKVVGLINIQFAIQDDVPYIIEANPRASRYACSGVSYEPSAHKRYSLMLHDVAVCPCYTP